MVIPHPLDDLEQSLPIANCWLKNQADRDSARPQRNPKKTRRTGATRLAIYLNTGTAPLR